MHNSKTESFDLFTKDSCFTDDTVLTVAVCDALLQHSDIKDGLFKNHEIAITYAAKYKQYYSRYPHSGFGEMFKEWATSNSFQHQRSYGNGAAMRVAPIAYAFNDIKDVQKHARLSCSYTHNNKEAIIGAQAVSSAVFLAKNRESKQNIKSYIEKVYKYNLSFKLNDIREKYVFDSRTNYSVPQQL